LPAPGGPYRRQPFGDADRIKRFGVLDWEFNDRPDFFDLFLAPTDQFIGRIRNFADPHKRDKRIDLGAKDAVDRECPTGDR
jgi:hypothetical protein